MHSASHKWDRRPWADVDGLTMLELVVALALAAILAGIAVLSHRALRPGLNLVAATRQVFMGLQVTRTRAVAQNVNYRLLFVNGGNSYRLQRQNGNSYDDEGQPATLPAGIAVLDCTSRDSTITFRPRGNAGTFGTITLQNSIGATRSVVVDIAGQVRVQ